MGSSSTCTELMENAARFLNNLDGGELDELI
jgi:hypothetical protein